MSDRADLLAWLRVVDLGVGMPPALISKFLSELGARVIAVPPANDPTPSVYPAYEVWRSRCEIRRDTGESNAAFDRLLENADVCLIGGEDYPGVEHRIDATALMDRYPRLVVLEITGYPAHSPHAGRPAVDVLVQARSGLAFEHYTARPLRASFEPSLYGAVLQGLSGLFGALIDRERSGRGQVVSTSLYEGMLSWAVGLWTEVERPNGYTQFIPPKDPFPLIFRCADGHYIHFVIGAPGSKLAIYQILGIDDPTVTPEERGLPKADDPPRNFFGPYDLLESHVRNWKCDELVAAISAKGFPAVRVLAPGESWDDEQVAMNGIIETDSSGRRHVGNPIIFQTIPARYEPAPPGRKPLSGVRIVDLGAYVAGPGSSVLLADLGADVIKVEQPGGDPGRVMFRSFNAANRGKRAIGLDLKSEKGREVVLRLCATADAVTNNFRAGVSERLGLDAVTLHRLKPDLVVLESSAWGPAGPKSKLGGFDPVAQAFTGHEHRGGGIGNVPLWSRTFVCDFGSAVLGAVATLAALYHRAVQGNGATLNAPLIHSGIYLLSELIQLRDGTLTGAPSLNSAQTGFHPTEAMYEAQDGWIAIAARGDSAARRLAEALDLDSVVRNRPAQWDGREEQLIAARVRKKSLSELAQLLEAADVWMEICQPDAELRTLRDATLIQDGTIHVGVDPRHGSIAEIGALMRFSRSERGSGRVTPLPGEHTRELLEEIGFTRSEIDSLYGDGVVF
jgi:crotonobetainyl-CoA:carnitine CoA-transferase CaiB-like acyl-CoA transferase